MFNLGEPSTLFDNIARGLALEIGNVTFHQFPDGERYVKIDTDVKNRPIILFGSLDHPDEKILSLFLFAKTAKDFGASDVGLIAPYLAYLRQDIQFNPGESVTSRYFATLLSETVDWLITIDPHLHRYHNLNEIYSIPTHVLHATDTMAAWITTNIQQPILIGPDAESEQWVASIANKIGAPYVVLQKIRHGDSDVEVSIPDIHQLNSHTPVLVDDIISTGKTMLGAIKHLTAHDIRNAYCVGVHAIFAGNAYQALQNTQAVTIVTCNTIPHPSNAIDVSAMMIDALQQRD
jgi:ribose-phosphate pyrophosphokinase